MLKRFLRLTLLPLAALTACAPTVATANPSTISPAAETAVSTAFPSLPSTVTAQPATNPLPSETPFALVLSSTPSPGWGDQTKTSGCVVLGALPDPACTPGDVFPGATREQVCTSGYSSSVRDVTEIEKEEVYAECGIFMHASGEYEVDHLVPLEIGGSNDPSNLWPEAAEPKPGFHEKDQVEDFLHDQVCDGAITLVQAQEEIAANWLAVYETLPGAINPLPQFAPASSSTQPAEPTLAEPTASGTGFRLDLLSSPVLRGASASAAIQTAAGAACSIQYTTPSGNRSTAEGLVPETADANGVCTWTWRIGISTRPGTGTVTIMANGVAQSFPIVVQ